jgi:hypothetical protein
VICSIFKDIMPLYTYIATYKGGTQCDQDKRSNFKGFASLMVARWPNDCLAGFHSALQKEAAEKTLRAEWTAVAGLTHVWVTRFDLNGHAFTLHAIQTEA